MERGFFDEVGAFFRRFALAFTGGGLQKPPGSAPYALFLWKIATDQGGLYTKFVEKPVETIQENVPAGTVRDTLIAAVQAGPGGYQMIEDKLKAEAATEGAVVWICIWIIRHS